MEMLVLTGLGFCLLASSVPLACGSAPMTPQSVEAIFVGRCLEYQEVLKPELFPPGKQKNCTKLWQLFRGSFAGRNPCEVPPERYEDYFREADHDIDTMNKVMLWSGKLFPFVENFASYTKKYLIIREVLPVHVIKNIRNWCGTGTGTGTGIDFTSCPEWGQCSDLAVSSFWLHASKKFAMKAKGVVNVMLNANSEKAFSEDSTFGKMELPFLDPSRTPKLVVHMVRNLDEQPKETCTTGSLLTLKKLVEKKKILFECRENEKDVKFLQCVEQPDKKECK